MYKFIYNLVDYLFKKKLKYFISVKVYLKK